MYGIVQDDLEFRDAHWRLLLADDSPSTLKVMNDFIADYPIAIDVVEDRTGESTASLLASDTFDLAFLDVHFANSNGIDLLREARQAGSRTFVTLMSASRPDNYLAMARQLDAYDYLVKPIMRNLFGSVLDAYAEARRRKHILLIDDSGTARRLTKRIIERSMFAVNVFDAGDGISGFELFAKHRPDVVFIDLNMEGIDGISTMRLIRAIEPTVPVVLMSADATGLAAIDCPYKLKKPFVPHQINELLYAFYGLRPPLYQGVENIGAKV